MKNLFKKVAMVVAVTMLAVFTVCVTGCAKKNTEFVVGLSGPLTGPAAVYGR